ncbi:MAG: hypothetical protein MUC83_09230 [Pirellula sp.]|nr:hypothetical protein [Pirellula sp.]
MKPIRDLHFSRAHAFCSGMLGLLAGECDSKETPFVYAPSKNVRSTF